MDNDLERIVKLEKRVSDFEREWENAKELTKACKESFDRAVTELRYEIRKTNEPELTFDVDKATGTITTKVSRIRTGKND